MDFAWTISAYEFYIPEDKDEALKTIENALVSAKSHPNLGERAMYTEELLSMKERITQHI